MTLRTLDLPLRPLLLANGAAATAFGICFLIRRGDGVLQTGSLGVRALCSRLMRDTDETRDAQRDSAEPEVLEQMDTLLGSLQQLKKEVSGIRRTCEQIKRERQQEQVDHSILTTKFDQMREDLKFQDELLKVSQDESEMKYRDVTDTNVQLEDKISDLESQLNKVNGYVQWQKREFSQGQILCQETKKDLELTKNLHDHMITSYSFKEISLLKRLDSITAVVAETQCRYERETGFEAQTQNSILELSEIVSDQRQTWRHLKDQQNGARRVREELNSSLESKDQALKSIEANCPQMMESVFQDFEEICSINYELLKEHDILKARHSELLKKCEKECEAHNALKMQYEQAMKEYPDDGKSLMNTVGTDQDLERLGYKFQTEKENLDLRDNVAKLEEMVWWMEEKLFETDAICVFIKKERQHLQEYRRMEKSQCDETMKQCDELLLEIEKERLAHNTLKMQYREMMEALKQCTESLNMDHIRQNLEKIPEGGGI